MSWLYYSVKIYEKVKNNRFISEELTKLIKKNKVENISRIYYVVSETARNFIAIDNILKEFINIKKTNKKTYNLLCVALSSILFCDNIPEYAICNEAVELSDKKNKKFVNAVLRNVLRNKNSINKFSTNIKYSFEKWFLKNIKTNVDSEIIFKSLNKKNNLCIRINLNKITLSEFILRIEKNVKIIKTIGNNVIIIEKWNNFSSHELFLNGYFYIQNISSVIAVDSIKIKNNIKILDMCSAPGGKALFLAEKVYNKNGIIYATDINKNRLELLEENCKRMNIDNIKIIDINNIDEKFDIVWLDVPCSCSGTVASNPEWKLHHKKNEFKNIRTQRELLIKSSKYVKKNGNIIYSTCSLFYKENEENINWFLKNNKNFKLDKFNIKNIKKEVIGYYNIYPWEIEDAEGFFISVLKKAG